MDQPVATADAEFLPLRFWAALTALALVPLALGGILAGVVAGAAPRQTPPPSAGPSIYEPSGYPGTDWSVKQQPEPFPSLSAPLDPPVDADGSQGAPIQLRDPGTVGPWHVTIDAGADVTSDLVDAGAPLPQHGRYVVLILSGMFEGEGQGDPAADLVPGVRDGGGTDWLTQCTVTTNNPLAYAGPVQAGQWFTAEVCLDLPPGPDDGSVLFLQAPSGEFRTYFR